MISFFTIASNDQSYYYLTQIFGNVGTVLQSNNPPLLLGTMFKSFNTTALLIGVLLVTHTTVMGLLKTAQEGEFLGKQWNSLWVPLRTVMGIVGLFPTAAGYSAIQIVMMWIIVQGIGAADSLWTVVMNYVSIAGSPYASVGLPTSVDISNDMTTLYKALTCEANAKRTDTTSYTMASDGSTQYFYFCGDPGNAKSPFCSQLPLSQIIANPNASVCSFIPGKFQGLGSFGVGTIQCKIGPNGACGSITFGDASGGPNSVQQILAGKTDAASLLQTGAYEAQEQILGGQGGVVSTLEAIAQQTAQTDNDYINFYANNGMPGLPTFSASFFGGGGGGSTATPPQPTTVPWILNFCAVAGQGLPQSYQCCLFDDPMPCDPSKVSAQPASSRGPQCFSRCQPFFPSDPSNDNGLDYTNFGMAEAKMYWINSIKPLVPNIDNSRAAGTTPGIASCSQPSDSKGNFFKTAVNNYTCFINTEVASILSTIIAQPTTNLSGWEADSQSTGWLLAGAYYYKIAAMNNNNLKNAIPPFAVDGKDPHSDENNTLHNYRNDVVGSGDIVTTILSTGGSGLFASPRMAQMSSSLNSTAEGITSSFMNTLTGAGAGGTNSNPLVAVQSLGEALLITVQVIFPVFWEIAVAILIIVNLNAMALGSGLASNPASQGVMFLFTSISTLVMVFCGFCITFGGLLGVYTPLVPYTIFTFGAIGWFMATIEALIAAPLVALGILSPGGQHEILGRAEPALMIILNTFLRPTLMIFGMMSAMLLSSVVIAMLNAGFAGVMGSILPDPGIFELIFFLVIYTLLVITCLNKCFALIHMIPERVLTWIGGQVISYGEAESVGAIKSGFEGAASAVSSGMQAVGNTVVEDIKEQKAANDEAERRKDKTPPQVKGENSPTSEGGDSQASGGESSQTPEQARQDQLSQAREAGRQDSQNMETGNPYAGDEGAQEAYQQGQQDQEQEQQDQSPEQRQAQLDKATEAGLNDGLSGDNDGPLAGSPDLAVRAAYEKGQQQAKQGGGEPNP